MTSCLPMTLAPRQEKIYQFILAELEAGRPVPTGAAIKRFMGEKSNGAANDVLANLTRKHRLIEWFAPLARYRYFVNQG